MAKKKTVKKKSSRKSTKKTVRKSTKRSVEKNSNASNPITVPQLIKSKKNSWGWKFINLLLVAIFVYGLWVMWKVSWTQGMSIVVAVLLIVFVIRLILKVKEK